MIALAVRWAALPQTSIRVRAALSGLHCIVFTKHRQLLQTIQWSEDGIEHSGLLGGGGWTNLVSETASICVLR
jgi:hypothetical protein